MADEKNDIILYQTEDGETKVQVFMDGETVWLTQAQMSELFQTDASGIGRHIKNVYKSGELDEKSTLQKMQVPNSDKPVQFYNLDVIISVGYRVNSHRGTQFRIWATKLLREYIIKGFVIDDDRLSGKQANYFDELLERVRKIRTSEVNFYEKVKAIFSASIDYQPGSDYARLFYSTVQNKFHYAITGHTAAELIVKRIDSGKRDMGMTHRKKALVTRQEAEVAENYLEEQELKRLELLVEQFLVFAELKAYEQTPMYMRDWIRKLDEFIRFNEKQLLDHAGKVSHDDMQAKVKAELSKYNQRLKALEKVAAQENRPELPFPPED